MFNGKYTSIDSILADILRYPFVEGMQREDVAIYLSEFTRLIGAPISFTDKVKEFTIQNYRVKIPKDLIYIKGIRYSNIEETDKVSYVPMRYASDIYHSGIHCDEAFTEYDKASMSDITYIVNDSYIQTSVDDGNIQIAYQALKTDDLGFPMIPDDPKVRQAFKYFILWNFAEPAYYRKDVPRDIYEDIKQQYYFYVGAATNQLNMPSMDRMKTLENGIIRLIKSQTQHENAWRKFQQKEVISRKDKTQRLL